MARSGAIANRVSSIHAITDSSVMAVLGIAQAAEKYRSDIHRLAATFALPGLTTDMNAKRNKLPLMIDVMTGFMVQYKDWLTETRRTAQ